MISVLCPNDNVPERDYAVRVIFSNLMGVSDDSLDIRFENDRESYSIIYKDIEVEVEDHFFHHYKEPLSYLSISNIPESIGFLHAFDKELPIIYGRDFFLQEGNKTTIGLDIFASTFFMLTRWEESLLGREEKGDCDENKLLTVRCGLHQRPFVHEYERLLRRLLWGNEEIENRKYKVMLTHDVDGFLPYSLANIIHSFVSQMLHGSPKNPILNLRWKERIKYSLEYGDPFSQFRKYISICEKHHVEELFYMKVCAQGEEECTYSYVEPRTAKVFSALRAKQSPVLQLGFHPSQSTFDDQTQWRVEKERLNKLLGYSPNIGRNHHLLYNYDMLRNWESMSQESAFNLSNCVFHKLLGFRSGVAVPYHLFDIYQHRMMKLMEYPCQIMDTSIREYRKKNSEEKTNTDIRKVIDSTKEVEGSLLLTWHIYVRSRALINEYIQWCEKIIEMSKR